MTRLSSIFAGAVVLAAAAEAAPNQTVPTYYNLTIDIRPSSHDFVAWGHWVIPAPDIVDDPGRSNGRSFAFESSEKLLDMKLSLDRKPVAASCRPKDGQLVCLAHFSAAPRPNYDFQLSYRWDGKPAPQIRIDSDQSFAGSSGDDWYPQFEGAIDKATLLFRAPKEFIVVAPGRLNHRTVEGQTAATEYDVEKPARLGFAAAPFVVTRGSNCSVYLLKAYDKASDLSEACAHVADALTHVWGTFPGGEVKIVEVDFKGILLGISESGYILTDSSEIRKPFDELYWGHELSHQWWGVSVHAKLPSQAAILLTEGMAEFGAMSLSRELGGDQGLADYLSDRHLRDSSGAPLPHYLLVLSRHEDEPLDDLNGGDGLRLHYIATSKGVLVIGILARLIGEDQFRRLCEEFARDNAGRTVTWASFEAFLQQRSGTDLSQFHAQWLDQAGLPSLYATWAKSGDGIDVTLHQCGSNYTLTAFPLQVGSELNNQFVSKTVFGNFRGLSSSMHFAGLRGVYRVNPDPNHLVPWLPGLCSR